MKGMHHVMWNCKTAYTQNPGFFNWKTCTCVDRKPIWASWANTAYDQAYSQKAYYVTVTELFIYLQTSKRGDKCILLNLAQPQPICGDIKVEFFHKEKFSKVRHLSICLIIHPSFYPSIHILLPFHSSSLRFFHLFVFSFLPSFFPPSFLLSFLLK